MPKQPLFIDFETQEIGVFDYLKDHETEQNKVCIVYRPLTNPFKKIQGRYFDKSMLKETTMSKRDGVEAVVKWALSKKEGSIINHFLQDSLREIDHLKEVIANLEVANSELSHQNEILSSGVDRVMAQDKKRKNETETTTPTQVNNNM